jgi:ribosomal protein L12E/L44/L45/RPP1/RPP2
VVAVYTFDPLGGRGRRISECKSSLVYRVNSRAAKATQGNSVSKKKRKEKKRKEKKRKEKRREEKKRNELFAKTL